MFSTSLLKITSTAAFNLSKILVSENSSLQILLPKTSIHLRSFALSNSSLNQDELAIFGNLRHRLPEKIGGSRVDDLENYNAFKLFDLKPKFNISKAKLQREMRNLQRTLHPDKFVDESGKVQEMSNTLSSMVNEYYHILRDPYKRAKYLLALMTNKSQSEMEESLEKLEMDSEFLSRMMDIRDQITNPNTERYELEKLSSVLECELDSLIIEINKLFEEKDTKAVIGRLGKLKFLSKCLKAAVESRGLLEEDY